MGCEVKPAAKHCFKVYAGLGPFTVHSLNHINHSLQLFKINKVMRGMDWVL